jgi:hypothetical protein
MDTTPSPLRPAPTPQHPMVTRSRSGIFKPNPRYANVATVPELPAVPTSIHAALCDTSWRQAMQEEHDAFCATGRGVLSLDHQVPASSQGSGS